MSRTNNDFGRNLDKYIKGRKANKEKESKSIGGFHELDAKTPELAISAVLTAKHYQDSYQDRFKRELTVQEDTRRGKEELALKKGLDVSKEETVDALFCFEKFNSAKRWKTKKIALEIYKKLKTEGRRLEAVKV